MLGLTKKAIYKTITWRIISIAISFFVSLWFTESVELAYGFTIVHALISTVFYYLHEIFYRWLRTKGKI